MLVGIDDNEQKVAAELATKGCHYYCPDCRGALQLKQGQQKIAHFAHVHEDNCQTFAEGETSEHLLGKLQLSNYFEQNGWQIELEPWLGTIKQRPDLLITRHGQRYAIEYQCAPISISRLQERNLGYKMMNVSVVWVLGAPYQHQRKQATWAKWAQKCGAEIGCYEWSTKHQRLVFTPWSKVDSKQPIAIWLERQALAIVEHLQRGHANLRKLQQLVYQQGHNLNGLPWLCHLPQQVKGGLKDPHWQVNLYLFNALEARPQTAQQLQQLLKNFEWYETGCVDQAAVRTYYLMHWLAFFQKNGMIIKKGRYWQISRPMMWYPDW